MSDFKRYAINIRKLAEQIRKSDSQLSDAVIRSAIAAERRIGYITGNGNTAVSNPGTPGFTNPFANFGNLMEFASDEELEKVMNTVNNNYKTINQALNMHLGGKLMGISDLKDCTTGQGVEINNTPNFKPPPNWDSPTQPSATNPIRWDLGFRYVALTTPATYGETAQEVVDGIPANMAGGPWVFNSYINPASIGSTAPFAANFQGPMSGSASFGIEKIPCAIGVDDKCPASRASPDWPADGKMQLVRGADGKYRYSENEPGADVIPEYTDNQHSKLDLCFDDGSGRKAGVESTYDGGYMLYERDPVTGDPIGRVQRFDSDNILVEHLQVEDMDSYRPTGVF